MSAANQILMGVFPGPAQIAPGFVFGRGRVNFGQQAGTQERGQLPGITAVRLDALARLARNQ
jgi:hypothetical protein